METTLGERIRLARKRAGLSQEEVAVAVGAAARPATVGEWEADKAIPEGRFLLKLPEVLRVSADWLFLGRADRGGIPIPSREVAEELRDWLDQIYPPEGTEGQKGGGGSE